TTAGRLSIHAIARNSNTHSHPFHNPGETLPFSYLLFLIYFVVLRGPSGKEPTICIVGPLFVIVGVSLVLLHHGAPPLLHGGIDPLYSPWISRLLATLFPLAKVLHIPLQICGAPIFSLAAIPTLFQYFRYFDPPTPPSRGWTSVPPTSACWSLPSVEVGNFLQLQLLGTKLLLCCKISQPKSFGLGHVG
ncbi:hypothetical protein Salat_0654800, partial [Sesamum alatum]